VRHPAGDSRFNFFRHKNFSHTAGNLEPVKLRNRLSIPAVARSISVRVVTLALTLSLVSTGSIPAHALEICDVDPKSVACITGKASSTTVVVNKIRPLIPQNYYPSNLVRIPKYNPLGRIVKKDVSAAIVKLGNRMKAEGKGTLLVQSGFRSYSLQAKIHSSKVSAMGKARGEKLVARPGHSEHQTGLAVDFGAQGVSTLKVSFSKTKAGIWLAANAYKYGFILRYPYGKTKITGYSYEPWHFRYVGVEVASAMHNQKIATLEEFYALPAAPGYLN
jgi:D-alanyl-D-alanine carboxypeptidase